MKKIFKSALFLMAAATMTMGMASCSSDNDDNGPAVKVGDLTEEDYLSKTVSGIVSNTINATYAEMAVNATNFYNQMKTLRDAVDKGNATQTMVDNACASWKAARACYEKSEAFLLGAASDYDIDPHIDTWPLDLSALHSQLLNTTQLARYTTDDENANIDNIHGDLNQNLLGFHSVEFIIFRDGTPRKVSSFNSTYDDYNDRANFTDIKPINELKFGVAVAGDLMGSIYELEVCWSGGTAEHKAWLDSHEWKTSMPSSSLTYGENMKNAGKSGSLYTSVKSTVSALLVGDQGCGGICDEVGQTKMGKPYGLNTNSENAESDPNYIESPFSHNSLTDFWDNIQSIKNIWFGGYSTDNTKTGTYSFHNYFASLNPSLGKEVEAAIDDAQAKIKACPVPFVNNYKNAQVKAAIDACTALSNKLTKANDYIQQQTK